MRNLVADTADLAGTADRDPGRTGRGMAGAARIPAAERIAVQADIVRLVVEGIADYRGRSAPTLALDGMAAAPSVFQPAKTTAPIKALARPDFEVVAKNTFAVPSFLSVAHAHPAVKRRGCLQPLPADSQRGTYPIRFVELRSVGCQSRSGRGSNSDCLA